MQLLKINNPNVRGVLDVFSVSWKVTFLKLHPTNELLCLSGEFCMMVCHQHIYSKKNGIKTNPSEC